MVILFSPFFCGLSQDKATGKEFFPDELASEQWQP
jgi:hypothetical protein